MNEVHIRVNDKGRHQPYRRINGLYALDVGPAFVSPRDAITYAIERARPPYRRSAPQRRTPAPYPNPMRARCSRSPSLARRDKAANR